MDIVDRLRGWDDASRKNSSSWETEAADEIDRLRAEVASLKEERDGVIETFNRQLMKDNALLGARVGELTQQLAAANGRVEMLRKALEHIESHTDSTNDGITYEICRAALSNLNEDSAG